MQTNWADVQSGLAISGWGLLGVFSVLILFYLIIVFLDKIKEKE